MHMAIETKPWERADLARLPDDGNRYEVLDGELLVTPQANPVHQRLAAELMYRLEPYCQRHALGIVVGPGAVPVGKSELQPDVQVIPCTAAALRRGWAKLPRPLLVVEIVSEGSRRFDRGKKRDAYLAWRIADYWIVDPEERTVTVARVGREDVTVRDEVAWQPMGAEGAAEPLKIDVAGLFRGAMGD
jgi:Uma2 family endonuclease